jgi:3-hydroxyisobutyrate dehydrogenase-like beta-hydroxyacid dehydrogenase
VFSDSAVASPLVKYKAASLAGRDFAAAFTTSMMAKDLDVALQLAHDCGTALPTTAHSHELLRAACAKGWGELDFSSLLLLFEDLRPAAGDAAGAQPRLSEVPS